MNFQESLNGSTLDDVGGIMASLASDDDMLENLFRAIKRYRADLWLSVRDEFAMVAYFYEDSSNKFIAKLAKQCIRKIESVDRFEEIMKATGGDLGCLQLKHETLDKYVVFTPDAYSSGRFRYTNFDAYGFFGHCIRNSYAEALKDAIACHYTLDATGTLEAMFESEYFVIDQNS